MIPQRMLWTVPGLVALHNAEEALAMPAYLPAIQRSAPAALRPVIGALSPREFFLALGVATIVPVVLAVWAWRRPSAGTHWAVALVQAVMALNVASHLVTAAVLGGYAPGVVTAVAVNLPFSVHFFRRAARERWLSRRALWATIPAAVLVHGPGLVGLFLVASRVATGHRP